MPPTPGETALMLRLMLATLFLSDGTPMVAAGDEYGHSLRGHDDAPWAFKHDANAFRWDAIGVGERGGEITRFMAACASVPAAPRRSVRRGGRERQLERPRRPEGARLGEPRRAAAG